MEEKPNYYAVIPASVRYDKTLRANEKLLYGEITALASKTGACWASNEYFSTLYEVSPRVIAIWISHLKEKEYIVVDYELNEGTKEIDKRIIKIGDEQKFTTSCTNVHSGDEQKFTHNNTSNNNTSNKKEIYKEKRFKKPTLQEVEEYCKERENSVNAEQFIDFYESNGWKVGKNSMKDWKAAVRTWERNRINEHKETRYEREKRLLEEMCKDEEE